MQYPIVLYSTYYHSKRTLMYITVKMVNVNLFPPWELSIYKYKLMNMKLYIRDYI